MDIIQVLLIIIGGVLALSSVIVAKKPDAKQMLDKLTPYQAIIGVVMLGWGVIQLLSNLSGISIALKIVPAFTMSVLAMIIVSILLGFMFGMPQIAKWLPGQSNTETKALELSRKLAPFQVMFGVIGLAAAALYLLIRFGLVSPM
ncbi:MAG: hypothetical protein ACTHU0_07965 [Kofleriaceae bacterium]